MINWYLPGALAFVVVLLAGLLPGSTHAQIEEVPRPERAHAASFGVSVALGDSIAAVGTSGEALCGPNAGAVYVYERVPTPPFDSWRVTARLTPRTCRANAFFGADIALSGERLLVSASSENRAREETDAAYVFERDTTGQWRQAARFTGEPGRQEGVYAADIDLDGDRAVVSTTGNPEGAYGGAVYVYEYRSARGAWTQTARLTASRGVKAGVMGQSVALDGDRLAVAASTYFDRDPGAVYLFRQEEPNQWQETTLIQGVDAFQIALDLYGSTLVVGEDRAGGEGSGQATLYRDDGGGNWERAGALHPSIPYDSGGVGAAVSVEQDWALITGYDEQLDKEFNIDRVVYVFRRRGKRAWRQRTILDVGQVDFGAALAQNGSMALVSSVPDGGPGTVYVVQLP
jgi:hypothetical protein